MTTRPVMRRVTLIETLVFSVGLIASVVAGVTAYSRYGIYGDGPGGAGFRRENDPVSGSSRLVHELATSEGRLRRIFGPGGAIVEVELDRNGDGNVEECVKMIDGRPAGVGFSRSGDGIIDAWTYRDAGGQVIRIDVATRRNHVVDRWEFYTNGVLSRVEIDTNGDGKPDAGGS